LAAETKQYGMLRNAEGWDSAASLAATATKIGTFAIDVANSNIYPTYLQKFGTKLERYRSRTKAVGKSL